MDEGVVAHVEFAYAAQESDELTLAVGDVVKNCIQKEDGSFLYYSYNSHQNGIFAIGHSG